MSKYQTVFITDRLFIKEVALEDVYDIHQLHPKGLFFIIIYYSSSQVPVLEVINLLVR